MNHDAVKALVARVLEVTPEELTAEGDFQDEFEADSLALAEVAAALETEFGLPMDPENPPRSLSDIHRRMTGELQ
ncbi:phosphopantetheine-binding protein [Natronoglycomyces albus]|uniref:Carrier domain-containing protein n=1 Tax=Natronoglycomyces albus TaxID=2811108 RepID=A0A895XSL3_9ACTN|nr:phosphopantetheine-binding protein [Natronoglycomyces albus]QSB06493.1 hypothetical protein JQS30_06210 [Natronoglycomyces albus]